ncbi:MAG TPA: radical SAM family heme chaperone HemW [Thermoanaerobaculia bacterium]|nr:radical SAM family heme chaperone HemW [Thermoanaerobaculia bacterium]
MPAPGLYLHVPFCSAICPYCDFAVRTGGRERRARFVEHLLEEIELWSEKPPALAGFDTVYLGGGTPSCLLPEELARVLAAAFAQLGIATGARVFLEANPEDVNPAALAAWRDLGVATLSLGVQSFAPEELAFLGRRHDARQARRSVELALAAGFETVSIDLIYGLPWQAPSTWRRTLDGAIQLAPHHLSCYQLTFHEGTPFGARRARGALAELAEPAQAELFALTHAVLADAGYPAYEVSSFARAPEHRSRHNRKYWDHTPYLGLGPSAHSFDGRRRWWNERGLDAWERRVAAGERPLAGSEELGRTELALEALLLGLRTAEGVDLAVLRRRYGVDLSAANGPLLARLAADGLAALAGGRLVPSPAGLAVADGLAAAFVLDAA